jgi:hypothetical protein
LLLEGVHQNRHLVGADDPGLWVLLGDRARLGECQPGDQRQSALMLMALLLHERSDALERVVDSR